MTVRLFYSTETGLGAVQGVVGSLITALDKVLVNGYNSQSLTSVTRVGTTATATKNAHGFREGQRILHAGWDQAEYNGEFFIFNVATNTYDFTITGTPATPATGATPTAKVAPLGFGKPFAGTNLAVYRAPSGNRHYLRVDDTGTTTARAIGYESMTDVNTGTNGFPTNAQVASGLFINKSGTASAVDRAFIIVGDEKRFYIFVDVSSDTFSSAQAFFFGEVVSYKSGDVYNSMIIGPASSAPTTGNTLQMVTSNNTVIAGHYMARSYTQTGGSTQISKHLDYVKSNAASTIGSAGGTYPDPVSGALNVSPIFLSESVNANRGELPGIIGPLHNRPLTHGDTYDGSDDYAGKKFLAINMYSGAQVHLEISNTW